MQGLNVRLDTSPAVNPDEPKTTYQDDNLGQTLQARWVNWKTTRRQVEELWLEDLRAYSQQNEPDVEQLSKFHSHIYIGETRSRVNHAFDRLNDLIFSTQDKFWSIEPRPIPDDVANNPEGQAFIDKMQTRCELMSTKMEDQLEDLQFEEYLKQAIQELCILGTGCVKGIIPDVKKKDQWTFSSEGEWTVVSQEYPFPGLSSPSIFDTYVDPYANRKEDMQGVYERHILNRQQFAALKDNPQFDSKKINEILVQSERGNHVAEWHETTRRNIAKITDTTATMSERFDLLEYWGQVTGRQLMNVGLPDIEESETYWANVWVCSSKTLLAKIMPMAKQQIPYNFGKYEKVPHQFWGVGPARTGRSSQLMLNGAIRSLLDGMAMMSTPMAEVNVHMLKDGQDPAKMAPGMIYLRDSGDPSVPAVRFFQPSIPSGQLMQIVEMCKTLSSEETRIPSLAYGSETPDIQDTTASGTAMRMKAQMLPIKGTLRNIEEGIIIPLITSLYDWNMQWGDDESIKGDYQVIVHGTSALIAKDVKATQCKEFLQITNNPIDNVFVDRKYLLRQEAKALELDPEKVIPDQVPPENAPPATQPNPVDVAKSELIKAQTETEKGRAKLVVANAAQENIKTVYESIQSGGQIAINPNIVPISDSLLQSAGYVDANGAPVADINNVPVVPNTIAQNTHPNMPALPPSPGVGLAKGIETQDPYH